MKNAMDYANNLTLDQFRTYLNFNVNLNESLVKLSDETSQLASKLITARKQGVLLYPEHDPRLKEATDHLINAVSLMLQVSHDLSDEVSDEIIDRFAEMEKKEA